MNTKISLTNGDGGDLSEEVEQGVSIRVHNVVPLTLVIVNEETNGVCVLGEESQEVKRSRGQEKRLTEADISDVLQTSHL